MDAENQTAERVLKLLPETTLELPASQAAGGTVPVESSEQAGSPLVIALLGDSRDRGISELNSPLSE